METIKQNIAANEKYIKQYQAEVKDSKIALAGYNKKLSEATEASLIELLEISITCCKKHIAEYKDCTKYARAELKLNKKRLAEIEA